MTAGFFDDQSIALLNRRREKGVRISLSSTERGWNELTVCCRVCVKYTYLCRGRQNIFSTTLVFSERNEKRKKEKRKEVSGVKV